MSRKHDLKTYIDQAANVNDLLPILKSLSLDILKQTVKDEIDRLDANQVNKMSTLELIYVYIHILVVMKTDNSIFNSEETQTCTKKESVSKSFK